MHRTQKWWDRWFLGLAQYISTASKDPSTQVGSVIVDAQRRIISTGYNGFPRGVVDDARLEDRASKYELTVHAEANAILFAQRDVRYCTIYTWPTMSCARCASLIIQAGILVHISQVETDGMRGLRLQHRIAAGTFREGGVEVVLYNEEGEIDAQKNQGSAWEGQEVWQGDDAERFQRDVSRKVEAWREENLGR